MDYTRAKLNLYADLAVIGVAYASGRLTRQEYIDAAVGMGLSEDCAKARALTYDLVPMASCT